MMVSVLAEVLGLSPLARGNHTWVQFGVNALGSIPARTGEPWQAKLQYCGFRVYPRSHGGT